MSLDRYILIPAIAALALFALAPTTKAVNPRPDGSYPHQDTAEGLDALLNLTTGSENTALGFNALRSNTGGFQNTAVGSRSLRVADALR